MPMYAIPYRHVTKIHPVLNPKVSALRLSRISSYPPSFVRPSFGPNRTQVRLKIRWFDAIEHVYYFRSHVPTRLGHLSPRTYGPSDMPRIPRSIQSPDGAWRCYRGCFSSGYVLQRFAAQQLHGTDFQANTAARE